MAHERCTVLQYTVRKKKSSFEEYRGFLQVQKIHFKNAEAIRACFAIFLESSRLCVVENKKKLFLFSNIFKCGQILTGNALMYI